MKEEIKYSFNKLNDAFVRLKEGVKEAKDELGKDGVIQRFEFTFELLWKTLKIFLREKGIDVNTPKDNLKEAFRLGWLREESVFLDMLEDRNKTSHIYDKEASEEIFERIKKDYLPVIEGIVVELRGRMVEL